MIRTVKTKGKAPLKAVLRLRQGPCSTASTNAHRFFQTSARKQLASEPEEVFTKLSDENDPNRQSFFNYTWGTWLKNDKLEKEKRVTKFSLEGLNKVLNDVYDQSKELAKNSGTDPNALPPSYNKNLTVTLPHNITKECIGTNSSPIKIKTMSSIHEGKHHRIYKIDADNDQSFILRIPYPMESEFAISQRLKSEVATHDFADLKLKIKVPKIFCFGVNAMNPIRTPFVLQEYIEGDLLMKGWDPLVNDTTLEGESYKTKLNKVIQPLADYQAKLASVEFKQHGSLYFANHMPKKDTKETDSELYGGESEDPYKGRWSIGPSMERGFWRARSDLKQEELEKFLGPWDSPSKILTDLAQLELTHSKLKLTQNGKSDVLRKQVKTFENLLKLAPHLFNEQSKNIPNVEKLFKPRLQHPDLDPMNVIVTSKGENYLTDFEGSVIKPFMYNIQPQFVSYEGPKLYKFDENDEQFKKLSPPEQEQYKFVYKRTRNLFLWEFALNETTPELIYSVAPQMKLLKAPILSTLNKRTDEDHILVDEKMIQLKDIWELMAKNNLVTSEKFPLSYSEKDVEEHTADMNKNNENLMKSPFAATQGWIPADMFENFVAQKILIKQDNGDYEFNPDTL